ncbi:hypothetical protein [Rhodococcus sp. 077-4]|uniref:hypothetical protein n=1 Tax=Rhodococcus sp. 077-4 TaxID=2789271 RepID=UPI0039F4C56C
MKIASFRQNFQFSLVFLIVPVLLAGCGSDVNPLSSRISEDFVRIESSGTVISDEYYKASNSLGGPVNTSDGRFVMFLANSKGNDRPFPNYTVGEVDISDSRQLHVFAADGSGKSVVECPNCASISPLSGSEVLISTDGIGVQITNTIFRFDPAVSSKLQVVSEDVLGPQRLIASVDGYVLAIPGYYSSVILAQSDGLRFNIISNDGSLLASDSIERDAPVPHYGVEEYETLAVSSVVAKPITSVDVSELAFEVVITYRSSYSCTYSEYGIVSVKDRNSLVASPTGEVFDSGRLSLAWTDPVDIQDAPGFEGLQVVGVRSTEGGGEYVFAESDCAGGVRAGRFLSSVMSEGSNGFAEFAEPSDLDVSDISEFAVVKDEIESGPSSAIGSVPSGDVSERFDYNLRWNNEVFPF